MNTELLKSRDHKPWRESKLKVKSLPECGRETLCVFSADGQAMSFFSFAACFATNCPSRTPDKLFRWDFWIGCWKCDPIYPPDFLCTLETLISEPVSSSVTSFKCGGVGEVTRWGSHIEVKRAKGEIQRVTFC